MGDSRSIVEPLRVDLAPRMRIGEPGAGERMPPDQIFRQAEFAPDLAHFVLEQFAQRLDQLERMSARKPAHVVMRLDGRRRTAASH